MPDQAVRQHFDKSKLPSRHVTVGPARAAHRSFFYAMGVNEDQLAQPIIGVCTTRNAAAPCSIALSRQAQAAKKGAAAAGGTLREFTTTITVTDGIVIGHAGMKAARSPRGNRKFCRAHHAGPLLRRARGLAGCDKSLTGPMMTMLRIQAPQLSGSSMKISGEAPHVPMTIPG